MRIATAGILYALLAGCGRADRTIEGTLLDPESATHVWVEGASERAEVVDGSFRLGRVRGDTIDLRFADAGDEAGWMRILDLPPGGRLSLLGVWFESGVALPTSVELAGARTVAVNGLRMASPRRIPRRVASAGSVLARSEEDALLVRPEDPRMPDLRVVITPGTRIRGEDGDPVSLRQLAFGHRVLVQGATEGGYVLAGEITVPREVSAGFDAEGPAPRVTPERVPSAPGTAAPEPAPVASPSPPAADRDAAVTPPSPPAADQEPPGRGRGQGRGRGRGQP